MTTVTTYSDCTVIDFGVTVDQIANVDRMTDAARALILGCDSIRWSGFGEIAGSIGRKVVWSAGARFKDDGRWHLKSIGDGAQVELWASDPDDDPLVATYRNGTRSMRLVFDDDGITVTMSSIGIDPSDELAEAAVAAGGADFTHDGDAWVGSIA